MHKKETQNINNCDISYIYKNEKNNNSNKQIENELGKQNQLQENINQVIEKDNEYYFQINQYGIYLIYEGKLIKYQNDYKQHYSEISEKYVICTDLDHTLVCHSDNSYQDSFKEFYLKNLIFRKNFVLIYSTARNFNKYLELQNKFNLLQPHLLVIGCGSQLFQTNLCQNRDDSPDYIRSEVYQEFIQQNWNKEIIQENLYENLKNCNFYYQKNPNNIIEEYRIDFLANNEVIPQFYVELQKIINQIQQKYHSIQCKLLISNSQNEQKFIDVIPINADKGNSIKFICEQILKIPLKNVFCFGDSSSDLDMLKICGKSILVNNSDPELISWHLNNQQQFQNISISNYKYSHAIISALENFLNLNQ